MSRFFLKQTKGKTIRRDSKTQVSKTNKGNIILKTTFTKKKLAKKDVCKTRKQRGDIPMFLKTGSRQRKNTKDTKKRKNKKKKSIRNKAFFFLLKRNLQKKK